jgi:FecR protein
MRKPSRGACALLCVLLSVSPAAARVGVTSATEGDPTGKPPMDAERILRVGIDVVADELITTNANDRAHLVFLDGTSLTVSPNARLKIDRYVYDPASQTGSIGVTAAQGVFRLVGGKISKSNDITVKTPSATLGLRGGISVFAVGPTQTTAQFLFGKSLVVTGNGRSETALRPGVQIQASLGAVPTSPVAIPPGALAQSLHLLEAARPSGDAKADVAAKQSGFSDRNSGGGWRGPTVNTTSLAALTTDATNVTAQARPIAATLPTAPAAVPAMATVPLPPPPPPVPVPPTTGPGCVDGSFSHHHHHHRFHHAGGR